MSNEQPVTATQPAAEVPPYVHLFQKAHQNIGLLEQIDEQLAQLWSRRQELQRDLRTVQSQINEELEDWIHAAGEPPKQILTAIATAAASGSPHPLPPLATRANANSSARFATQPLTAVSEP